MRFSRKGVGPPFSHIRALLARKEWEEAGRQIESALRFYPDDEMLLSLAADLYRKTSRPKEARAFLERARASGPAHEQVLAVGADLAFDDGNYEEASRGYRTLLDRRPSRWYASRLVLAYNRSGEHGRARDLARTSLERYPDDPWLLRGLALAESKLGNREEAVRLYERILELEPKDRLAYKMLMELRTASFSAGEAASALKGIMRSGERAKNPHLRILAGERLRKAGNLEQAIAEYETALALEPGNPYALSQIGFCYHRQGRTEEAVAYLEKAFLADPGNPYVRRTLESLLGKTGRLGRFVELIEEALRLHPGQKSLYGVRKRAAKKLADSSETSSS